MDLTAIITLATSLIPRIFRKKTPHELVAREIKKELRLLEREYRRKDSAGGRSYTKEELEDIAHLRRKYIDHLTNKFTY